MVGLKRRITVRPATPAASRSPPGSAPNSAKSPDDDEVVDQLTKEVSKMNTQALAQGDLVVHRAPVVPFLSVPKKVLFRQYRAPMPSGWRMPRTEAAAMAASARSASKGRRPCLGMTRKLTPISLGKGFRPFKITEAAQGDDDDDDNSGDSDDSGEEDKGPDKLAQAYELNPLVLWEDPEGSGHQVIVPLIIGKYLRDHQREGVRFLFECVCGLREFEGKGCILADDMGLGKTLQSITLLYTMLQHGRDPKKPEARRIIVVTPTSLVRNWDKELDKWLKGKVRALALAEVSRKEVIKLVNTFRNSKMYQVLIISYDTFRIHSKLFEQEGIADLLICDEAHRLKNDATLTSRALDSLKCPSRILLSGTPMQNDLEEFYAMVQFCNPNVLGTVSKFRKHFQKPILDGRDPEASDSQVAKSAERSTELSNIVNQFILRRTNSLLSKHLPPKLTQVVCVKMSEMQKTVYQHLLSAKSDKDEVRKTNTAIAKAAAEAQAAAAATEAAALAALGDNPAEGDAPPTASAAGGDSSSAKKSGAAPELSAQALSSINNLKKVCNHPQLVYERPSIYKNIGGMTKKQLANAEAKQSLASFFPDGFGASSSRRAGGRRGGGQAPAGPTMNDSNVFWSGKFLLIANMLHILRTETSDRIVLVSNYTQTLDVFANLCRENDYPYVQLDGTTGAKKRQAMVDRLNDPNEDLFVFLLSSKAGGCGLNMIGANRLVLFDPDWNPATDKQAAARVWRDGQKKRSYVYRFLATGSIEEKIFQRQLSKEGLQGVVDDDQSLESAVSSRDLKDLFRLREGTVSDTHDKFKCARCDVSKVEQHTRDILDGDLMRNTTAANPATATSPSSSASPGAEAGVKSTPEPSRATASVLSSSGGGGGGSGGAVGSRRGGIGGGRARGGGGGLGRRRSKFQSPAGGTGSAANVTPTPVASSPPPPTPDAPQVGCPGDGDMNEWSHHLGCSTADDEVLRRAGQGLVTFIFGQAIDGESLALVAAAKARANALKTPDKKAREQPTANDPDMFKDDDDDCEDDDNNDNNNTAMEVVKEGNTSVDHSDSGATSETASDESSGVDSRPTGAAASVATSTATTSSSSDSSSGGEEESGDEEEDEDEEEEDEAEDSSDESDADFE